jgi:hypothetical protein
MARMMSVTEQSPFIDPSIDLVVVMEHSLMSLLRQDCSLVIEPNRARAWKGISCCPIASDGTTQTRQCESITRDDAETLLPRSDSGVLTSQRRSWKTRRWSRTRGLQGHEDDRT